MKSPSTKVLLLLLFLGFVAFGPVRALRRMWLYDHIEENARKVVTAEELQVWATNLLAIDPGGTNLERNWGPSFPEQLRKLAPRSGPLLVVYGGDDRGLPSFVRLWWGSGELGASGFEIGPTDFPGWHPDSHEWAPGVYFFR